MRNLFLLFLFLPIVATAQWSITPEAGVLFSKATGVGMKAGLEILL
jgi:hypothetical protein